MISTIDSSLHIQKRRFFLAPLLIALFFLFSFSLLHSDEALFVLEPIPDQPGAHFRGVIELSLPPSVRTYWKHENIGVSPTFSWVLPEGISLISLQWPVPKQYGGEKEESDIPIFGYEGKIGWIATFERGEKFVSSDHESNISGVISWIACSDRNCTLRESQFKASLQNSIEEEDVRYQREALFKETYQTIPKKAIGIKAYYNREDSSLTVMLSPQVILGDDENYSHFIVDSAELFLENKELQNSSHAKLLMQENKRPFAIYLKIPEKKVTQFVDELIIGGVYRYKAFGKDPSDEKTFLGSFTDVIVESDTLRVEEKEERVDPVETLPHIFASNPISIEELVMIACCAFFGGIILNLMPCVFPVIGLKVLHIISFAGEKKPLPAHHKEQKLSLFGISYSCGVIAAFWCLALLLYTLQYCGKLVGWGFQLQEPSFVLLLIALIFVMSLMLFGVCDFTPSLASKSAEVEHKLMEQKAEENHKLGIIQIAPTLKTSWYTKERLFSFISGFFTALITTPCTGPLLGSVLGFLTLLHPIQGIFIFTSLGLGVAFPYLILTLFPSLLQFLPRPGRWMDICKKILGFSLLGTIIWLSWVLQNQLHTLSLPLMLTIFASLSLAMWIGSLWQGSIKRQKWVRVCVYLIISLLITSAMISGILILSEKGTTQEESSIPFSKSLIKKSLETGRPVFVEVSAKWCLTCQTNRVAFLSKSVQKALKKKNVIFITADWTKKDEEITAFLREYGRNSVPTYIYFASEKAKPIILPEIITASTVIEAINP